MSPWLIWGVVWALLFLLAALAVAKFVKQDSDE